MRKLHNTAPLPPEPEEPVLYDSPVILALDVDQIEDRQVIQDISPYIGAFKVGLQLFIANGIPTMYALKHLTDRPVFLDLKLCDIPTTVGKAIKALKRYDNIKWLSVMGDDEDRLKAAVEEAGDDFEIVAITHLTSKQTCPDRLNHSMFNAQRASVKTVVLPPYMTWRVREAFRDFTFICPGIRYASKQERNKPYKGNRDDHQATMEPREALEGGADWIVVGRPVTQAEDWVLRAKKIWEDCNGVRDPRGVHFGFSGQGASHAERVV
jgi:orotidine-5'-phosphate decarboxylase